MARIRQPKKVKEPVRLRMKDLSNGSKSLLEKPRDFAPFGQAGLSPLATI